MTSADPQIQDPAPDGLVAARRGRPPGKVRRALIIKLGHIGDVLVVSPAITALKENYPGVRITALVNQGTEAMLVHNPMVDDLIVLRRDLEGGAAKALYQARLLSRLAAGRFDLSLELSGGDRGAVLSLIAHAGHRVGFAPKKPHIRSKAFHLLVNGRGTSNHVVETFLRQPRALGLKPASDTLVFNPGEEARGKAREMLEAEGLAGKPYVVVHPTSRWMFKCWSPEGNARVVEHLAGKGWLPVLTSAPAPAEVEFNRAVREALAPGTPLVDFSGRLDLLTLGALIENARLFFGVDSAPMHMAAALGVPTAVMFGPSGEVMWGPWRVRSEVIVDESRDCRPCGRDGCEGSKHSLCLLEIPASRVIRAIDRLLEAL